MGSGLGDAELIDKLESIERKPPTYRVFRVTLYTTYIIIALWLVLSIAIASWSSVYGERGVKLRETSERLGPADSVPTPKLRENAP